MVALVMSECSGCIPLQNLHNRKTKSLAKCCLAYIIHELPKPGLHH